MLLLTLNLGNQQRINAANLLDGNNEAGRTRSMVPIQCDAISWSPNTAEPGEQGITYTQLQGPLKSGRESRAVHYTYQVVGLRNSDSDAFPPL